MKLLIVLLGRDKKIATYSVMEVYTGIKKKLCDVLDDEIERREDKIINENITERNSPYFGLWAEIDTLKTLKEIIDRWLSKI